MRARQAKAPDPSANHRVFSAATTGWANRTWPSEHGHDEPQKAGNESPQMRASFRVVNQYISVTYDLAQPVFQVYADE